VPGGVQGEIGKKSGSRLHYHYILQAGGSFKDSEGQVLPFILLRCCNSISNFEIECEISPLVSYAGEGLEEIVSGKHYQTGIHLETPGAHSDGNGLAPVAKKSKPVV
jgi:UDP-N-acetylglucosamine/UDP-N-acetylgalactosamine diphosphorylase